MSSAAPILSVIATAYGLAAGAASLLQARQMLWQQSSESVSIGFLASYVGGHAIWFLYGLSIGSAPLILVESVGAVSGIATVMIALYERCPKDWWIMRVVRASRNRRPPARHHDWSLRGSRAALRAVIDLHVRRRAFWPIRTIGQRAYARQPTRSG